MKRQLRAFAMLSVLTVGFMTVVFALGPTAAKADAVAKEPIQPVNGTCGAPTGNQAIGAVEFHRVKNTVDLNVHLHGARPDTIYSVFLIAPKSRGCTISIGKQGPLVTNDKGVGNGIFKFGVTTKDTVFLADIRASGTGANETPTVTLT